MSAYDDEKPAHSSIGEETDAATMVEEKDHPSKAEPVHSHKSHDDIIEEPDVDIEAQEVGLTSPRRNPVLTMTGSTIWAERS